MVARFDGGEVTAEELQREAARLPPVLRARFETPAGRRDLAGAIVDRKLLAREARRRKLDRDPELRRQVEELEEKLAVQALLAEEERQAGPPAEAELRAAYEASKGEPGHAPSFEAAREQLANRLAPQRKRRQFDQLLDRLRTDARVKFDMPQGGPGGSAEGKP